jgi:hypothetical protein
MATATGLGGRPLGFFSLSGKASIAFIFCPKWEEVVGRRLRALSVSALLEGSLAHYPLQIHFSPTRLETVYFRLPFGVT